MTRQFATRRRPWGHLALALLVALAPALEAAAPPAAAPEALAPGPLFEVGRPHTNPVHMALAVVGATPTRTGPFATLAVLDAGERTKAWSLEGVLTNRHSRVSLGAGTLVLSGTTGPFAELGTLVAGQQLDCWALLDTDAFRPLPQEWLDAVTDGRGIPVGGLEAEVYSRVMLRAHYTSAKAFSGVIRKDVTYSHLFEEPERYRGVVVPVVGRLLRVNRYAPPYEAAEGGVNDLYEAWVFSEMLGANPTCIVFTEWPENLSRDLLGVPKIDSYIKISLDGYFFKKLRYKSNDRRGSEREAPLVIGHALVVMGHTRAGSSSQTSGWIQTLVWGFGGVVLALILGVVGLTYWYRRSDNRVRRRILARMPEFALPTPESTPLAAPVAPVARPVNDKLPVSAVPRITFPAGRGQRGDGPKENGGNGKKEHPPDEGAGA